MTTAGTEAAPHYHPLLVWVSGVLAVAVALGFENLGRCVVIICRIFSKSSMVWSLLPSPKEREPKLATIDTNRRAVETLKPSAVK